MWQDVSVCEDVWIGLYSSGERQQDVRVNGQSGFWLSLSWGSREQVRLRCNVITLLRKVYPPRAFFRSHWE